ncbi:TonB-dependent receptor domain-containing protein [Simiduia agarivorans]|uniref:Outer membrane receptor protein n=1 Tax=Simiduia agarivorans (strain DSM 21679 / JCM 13881 / BCRC 17597 / SA1) TaxID=1117647 RepID=K4L1I6_SIMAS|nr:TonB-dependent receptor [Simiduia agarivorans]AFV00038.1 outer membrane receptor protein [Simiduia agarivorans SA1 = DSM 21679]
MKTKVLALAVGLASTTALAQTVQDEIVVTATRTETPLSQTIAPVTVLTAEDIAALQVVDVPELINRFAGLDLVQSGGRGATASAFVRGTNSSHLLVLVDGVRIDSATLGASAIQYLDPASIERIELVRGPRSSLYGSDAIGGTLQIFTRKASNEGANLALNVGYGSHNEQRYRLAGGFKSDTANLNATLSHHTTDGYDRTLNESYGDADDDAYSVTSASVSGELSLTDATAVFASAQYQTGESDTDRLCNDAWGPCNPVSLPYTEFSNGILDAGIKSQVNDLWRAELRAGVAQDESENFDHVPGVAESVWGGTNTFTTERRHASWQNDLAVAEGQLVTLGLDYERESVDSNNVAYDEDSRTTQAVFGQYQAQVGNHSFVLGARTDDSDQYGRKNTGNLSWGWAVDEAWTLVASAGTGFKAPSFNDLYWPFSGNPDLKPESSQNLEAGVKYRDGELYFAMNAFQNNIDDLIAWAPVDPSDPFSAWLPGNVNKAEIQGSELELQNRFGDVLVSANYTYLEPEDKATGNQLINRANQLFNLDVSRAFGPVTLGMVIEARSARYSDAANLNKVPGYGLLHARASWAVTEHFSLDARINNLLDKEYTVVRNFREDGINGFVSANVRF